MYACYLYQEYANRQIYTTLRRPIWIQIDSCKPYSSRVGAIYCQAYNNYENNYLIGIGLLSNAVG